MRASVRLLLLSALIPVCLGLSGCGVVGGVAYAIKQADKADDSQEQTSAPAPAAQQTRAAEPPPAPPPVAAKRESIQMEELK